MILDPNLAPYTKINSNWIKDKHKPETLKLLEENMREKLHGTDVGNNVMDMTPKAQAA